MSSQLHCHILVLPKKIRLLSERKIIHLYNYVQDWYRIYDFPAGRNEALTIELPDIHAL